MDWITNPEIWITLLSLTALEIVLGIDNVVFISILAGRLPEHQQAKARTIGLSLALITRVLLLLGISWMVKLTNPLFGVMGKEFSGRDLILIAGGMFLLAKSTHEIHSKLESEEMGDAEKSTASFASVIVQILILDVVFSLDSVITAVAMTPYLGVMIAAVVIALVFMLVFAGWISDFIHKHPTLKMLALGFLLLIGCVLVADGLHHHVPRGYIYFAMGFSVFIEALNIRVRKRRKHVASMTPVLPKKR